MSKRKCVKVAQAGAITTVETEERVQRRREQYRAYQRRRRAQERLRLERLEHDVRVLAAETSDLQSRNMHLFASRGLHAGAPASAVAEFYRVYAHGHSSTESAKQDAFLQWMMVRDVRGPDYRGVDALIEQWRMYGSLFVATTYVPVRTLVHTIDETTLVVVDVVLTVRPNRRGVLCLNPHFASNEPMVQRLLSQPIVARGSVRFLFDAAGKGIWLGADMDFVAGLLAVTGPIEQAVDWLHDSRLSMSTGHIASDHDLVAPARPLASQRHEIEFLLS